MRRFIMVKLIALDLDGTLTCEDHMTVTQKTRQALKKAHDAGAKISIATGRTVAIIGDICQQVPEVDYIIYSNGAGVLDRRNQKNIYTKFMPWSLIEPIFKVLDKMPAFFEVYVDGVSYYQFDKGKYYPKGSLPQEFVDKLLDKMTGVDNILETLKGYDIEKATVYFDDRRDFDKAWDYLSGFDELYLASSLAESMEFTMANVNKGTAIDGMCKVLGITNNECMAFGDAGNDIEMLEYCKYGFAMGNATDECKRHAKFITKSNTEDGVAYGIEQVMGI